MLRLRVRWCCVCGLRPELRLRAAAVLRLRAAAGLRLRAAAGLRLRAAAGMRMQAATLLRLRGCVCGLRAAGCGGAAAEGMRGCGLRRGCSDGAA